MLRTKLLCIVCTLAVLSILPPVYAADKFPEYPVRQAGEYANKDAKSGLIVAVEPVDDREQQKTYFKSNLSSKGILPVLIVIQNTSATDSYLFDKSAVGLGEAAAVTGKGASKTSSLLDSGGLVDLALINNATEGRDNMMKKEIRSKTLAPGASVHGFVYVPVATDAPREKMHLQVPLTNAQSGETEVINLIF